MANFPKGSFTITNNDTGRCLRARLGTSHDVSDYKEGTKYLQSVTDKPWVELGEPDGSIATAWYFDTADDSVERMPFNQIVSVAVRDLQNIGNYCVWMRAGELSFDDKTREEAEKEYEAQEAAKQNRSEARKRYLQEYIDSMVPKEWAASQKTLDAWEWWRGTYAFRKDSDNERLFWGDYDNDGRGQFRGDKDAVVRAIKAYIPEAAKDGVYIKSPWSSGDASTRMYGCGASRGPGSTYRWATGNGYIYAADDNVSSDKTCWTDVDGQLVGRAAGGPGQSWTIASWTPPEQPAEVAKAALLTGLFGPLGVVLGV